MWNQKGNQDTAEKFSKISLVQSVDDINFQPVSELNKFQINSNGLDTIVFAEHYYTDAYLNKSTNENSPTWLGFLKGVFMLTSIVVVIIAIVKIIIFSMHYPRVPFLQLPILSDLKLPDFFSCYLLL